VRTVLPIEHAIKDNRKTPIMAIKEATRHHRIVQINVRRSLTAMTELREYCNRHKIDIACIQEPAIRYGKLASVTTITVEVQLNRKSFYVINQYCQLSDPIEDHMFKLSNIHLLAQQHSIVSCADVNAKSNLWFSSVRTRREKSSRKHCGTSNFK